jgi:hypothetical protein
MLKIIIFILLFIIIFYIYFYKEEDYEYNYKDYNYIIELYSPAHLGDSVFDSFYFNYIKDFLEKENIKINYYINKEYHNQIKEFIISDNIKIKEYQEKGLNIHIINKKFKNNYNNNTIKHFIFYFSKLIYDIHYINFYNELSEKLNIPVKLTEFVYRNPKLISSYNLLPEKYKDLDILIINSIPHSGQFKFIDKDWYNLIYKLKNYKIAVTNKININNIPCTLDDKLTIFQIAAISTKSKIIIGINTGPMAGVFNEYTLNYTKKIYLFDKKITYSYKIVNNKKNINEINLKEINYIIKNFFYN